MCKSIKTYLIRLCLCLSMLLCLPCMLFSAEPADGFFSWPIGCIPGVSCVGQHFRIGYPDVDGNGKSYACGKPGYTGHHGTDIIVSSVEQGVSVMAAANGIVRWVRDGLYDHCPDSTQEDCNPQTKSYLPLDNRGEASLGFNAGNYIVLEHNLQNTRYLTLYAHLRKGSQRVVPGQRISSGVKIAEVGSSGNSRLPHLHFGVYKEEGLFYRPVDPWRGPCNSSSDGLWVYEPPYQSDNADIATTEGHQNQQIWPIEPQ